MPYSVHPTHKYSLPVYLLIANGITWLAWIPGLIIGAQQGYIMPNFDTYAVLFETGIANSQHLWLGVAFQSAVYGPLIGALVATWMDGGRKGLTDLWRRITRWNIGGRWYLIVLLISLLLPGLPVALFAFAGGYKPSAYAISYVLFIFTAQLLTSGLGEEPGWRGFLLPRLQARFKADKYVWVLGLIWAIWHYPFVTLQSLFATSALPDVTMPQIIITIITSLAGFTMSIVGISFIYVWLYNKTESVFLMIVLHACSNVFNVWLVSFLAEPQAVSIFVALMPWAVVVILQKRLGKEMFPGRLQPGEVFNMN